MRQGPRRGDNSRAVEDARADAASVPSFAWGAPDGWLLTVVRDRRVAFLVVGSANTVIGGLWFVLFDGIVGPWWGNLGHYLALVLGYTAAILCAFVLYRYLVFRVRGHWWRDLARFSTVYLSAFVANVILFAFLFHVLGFPPLAAQLVNIVVVATFSYVLHGRFSFGRPGPGGE